MVPQADEGCEDFEYDGAIDFVDLLRGGVVESVWSRGRGGGAL